MFCILIVGVTKVYIVDDHQMLIDGLMALLNGETHISVIGQNTLPKIAAKEIINLNPDIVLTDINMPEMDGVGFLNAVKKLDSNQSVKIIACSGESDSEILEDYKAKGFDFVLTKPIKAEDLVKIITA